MNAAPNGTRRIRRRRIDRGRFFSSWTLLGLIGILLTGCGLWGCLQLITAPETVFSEPVRPDPLAEQRAELWLAARRADTPKEAIAAADCLLTSLSVLNPFSAADRELAEDLLRGAKAELEQDCGLEWNRRYQQRLDYVRTCLPGSG